jgi:hypothetical protein
VVAIIKIRLILFVIAYTHLAGQPPGRLGLLEKSGSKYMYKTREILGASCERNFYLSVYDIAAGHSCLSQNQRLFCSVFHEEACRLFCYRG